MYRILQIIIGGFLVVGFAGCDSITGSLDKQPYQGQPGEVALSTVEGLETATRGNYSILKQGNYPRRLFHMAEFPGDNVMLSGTTGDPLFWAYNFSHTPGMGNTENVWRWAYQVIYGANKVVEAIEPGTSSTRDQLLGENLFLRAWQHLVLVKFFARPYTHGRDNPGIPIVQSSDVVGENPSRASVGEVYDFIVSDLERAAELMNADKSAAYASKEAAWALLSRVHLYREENDDAIEYANKVIQSGRYSLVASENYAQYGNLTPENNPEAIFAIKHTPADNHEFSAVGSMYYTTDNGVGWGQMYPSEDYRDLVSRYPDDVRNEFVVPQYQRNDAGEIERDQNGDPIFRRRNGYPIYYMSKFAREQGIGMLSSPEVVRLAEMYLNRAEAYAKNGDAAEAIEDVNRIRRRAGLTGDALYSTGDLKGHDRVLDVVLEERRLELAFEGHRPYDLFRNHRAVRRDYPGVHLNPTYPGVNMSEGTQIIPSDHNRTIFYLPETELELNSNLTQNP